jgi:hypothetical protein
MDKHQPFNAELSRALEAFGSSSRYGFLKSLQIGKLIGADADSLGEIAELTFEGLIELGTEHLHSLSMVQKRVLTSTLFALSEGDPTAPSEFSAVDADGAVINSVQAEIALRERLQALQSHPQFAKNKLQKLGNFWDATWPRAPFEEAFTLSQLVSIDLSTLQKKRSVGPSRIVLLTKAVDRVLSSLSGMDDETNQQEKPVAKPSRPEPIPQRAVSLTVEEPRLHPWMSELGKLTIFEAALLEYVLQQPARLVECDDSKAALVGSIATVFSASEIVLLAQLNEPSKPLAKKLKAWLVAHKNESEVAMLQEALQGPGLHVDRILALLNINDWPPSFGRLVAVMLLRAIGAQPIKFNSQECREVFSLNPSLAQLLVSGLKGSTKSAAALSNLLKVACPAMDPFLHSWLCEAVKSSKRR